MKFNIVSDFAPTGDQPQAIDQLVKGIERNDKYQVLLGVTGSGKTFTIANVVERIQRPTLVLAHNKTLAAQLYSEFKAFFPNNAVEYFVSYYDYYQPEAYIPSTGTYIEKDLSINDEIEKLRLSTTSALLSGRRDVLVVASVSCLYGIGNPVEFQKNVITLKQGDILLRTKLMHRLVQSLYARTTAEFRHGNFRIKGDVLDVFPGYDDNAFRIHFFGDEIEEIEQFDPTTNHVLDHYQSLNIYPANMFVTSPDILQKAIWNIQQDLVKQVEFFEALGKPLEAKRLKERTEFDLEMIRELGYCSGIENYSRYLDGREPGTRPFCLIDYFPDDFLMVIDESHVTVSQVHAMYGGDRSRKENLVEYGFRLPAAMDNRPLKFEEFEALQNQVIYVSATPADYELQQTQGVYVEQVIRPTGLLDPEIEVRPSANQIDDLVEEIQLRTEKDERILVTTLTKRMAEELTKYLTRIGIRCRYIHSDVDLRSTRSLTQTVGRAARNVNGKAIMYADKITESMQRTIDDTNYRREKQMNYNKTHNITPQPLHKKIENSLSKSPITEFHYDPSFKERTAAEAQLVYLSAKELEKKIKETRKLMEVAAKELDFVKAAQYRDELKKLQELAN